MTVDLEQVLGLAVQVSILIAAIAALVVWLKHWVQRQVADPVRALNEQVRPNGGNQDTTRHLVEQIQEGQAEIIDRLDRHDEVGQSNRQLAEQSLGIATEALTISRQISDRLDRHLAEEHQP